MCGGGGGDGETGCPIAIAAVLFAVRLDLLHVSSNNFAANNGMHWLRDSKI